MESCIFCDIIEQKQPADIVYEDEYIVAFHDIHPKYPTHILVIPRKHIESVLELTEEDDALAGRLLRIGADIARKTDIAEDGFRLLTNIGPHAGQAVDHIHVHVLGGEPLRPI